MVGAKPRRATDRRSVSNRWKREIVRRLEDFPRQYGALENAMGVFGNDFDPRQFKEAFDTTDDMDAYNRVQAVERAVSRVQNFIGELAEAGVKLAQLAPSPGNAPASPVQRAFEALRDEGVIDASVCRRLTRAQNARSKIEHAYVHVPAGDVHRTVVLVHDTARDFIGPYRAWIAAYLDD
jgi:uncharacterized protein YutE (UPF0331/DUF86 family)